MGMDGPGVSTLAAGAGCPLHCRWCINARLLREAPAENITAARLLERVKIDDLYFRATGGGVTFGGGESLLHAPFIRRFRELCPEEWKLCAETGLAVSRELVQIASEAADTFLVDCKDMDPEIYHRYTGGDERIMEDNLKYLLDRAGPDRVTVRVPLIPGYNTPEDREKSVRKLRGLGAVRLDIFEYTVRPQMRRNGPENTDREDQDGL